MPIQYFLIKTLGDANDSFDGSSQGCESCEACGHLLAVDGLADVQLSSSCVDLPFSFLRSPLLPVVRQDFAELIGINQLAETLRAVRVFFTGFEKQKFWALAKNRTCLQLRGGRNSSFRWCNCCGNVVYTPSKSFYLLADDVKESDVSFSISGFTDLIVDAEIHRRLAESKWKKIKFTELPILEKPRDGLPNDLAETPKPHSQNQPNWL